MQPRSSSLRSLRSQEPKGLVGQTGGASSCGPDQNRHYLGKKIRDAQIIYLQ
jgi:hypothetical protein